MFKKKSSKFSVKSAYKYLDFEFQNGYKPENINIKWSRHKRVTESMKYGETPIWNQTEEGDNGYVAGRCNYKDECSPTMLVTFHKGKKEGFESKVYRYTVESVNESGRATKVLANADIDLASYGDLKGSTHYFAIDMKPKQKFVLKAVLNVQVDFEFIKTANAKDPDMVSTWSKESESETISTMGIDSASTIGMFIDENVFSLAHQIQKLNDDVISPGAGSGDIFKYLPRCRLIILVFNGNWTEKSTSIVKALNSFYNKVKMHFATSLEIFYVSLDKDEQALLETIQQAFLKCPAIKPSSQLSNLITEHYGITKVPHLLVTSEDKVVEGLSGDDAILERLMTSDAKNMVDKWLEPDNKQTFSRENSFLRIESVSKHDKARKSKEMTTELLKEKEAVIDTLEADKVLLSSSNAQLELEVSKLNDKLVRQTSLIGSQVRKERKLAYETKILEAERDIRGTLMKRGVRGPTGRFWRPRFFQFEDNKIIYIDPKTMEAKGFIEISQIISMQKMPVNQQDKNGASFAVHVPGRVFEIQARDVVHMQTWIAAAEFLKDNALRGEVDTILDEPIIEESVK